MFRTLFYHEPLGLEAEYFASSPDLSKDNRKSYKYRLFFKRKNMQHVTLISIVCDKG
jgi:hypothetical protein